MWLRPWVALPIILTHLPVSTSQCHNSCTRNGTCDSTGTCSCFDGYHGADCSARYCPKGSAWADVASDTDQAHAEAECSNMGICDVEGRCRCHPGFEGPACERMSCPRNCNGHGQCLSMRQAAATNYGWILNRTSTYDEWDADKIYGCTCDAGYSGFDCSERLCDAGDSARTRGQQHESATLYCECPGTCTGHFKLRYKGQFATVYPNDTSSEVADKLMALSSERHDSAEYATAPIAVSFSGGSAVCSSSGVTSTIAFERDGGDLPPLYLRNNKLRSSSGTVSVYMESTVLLVCSCGSNCGGYFYLWGPDGFHTNRIKYDADEATVEAELSALESLSDVNVTVTMAGGAACADGSTANTTITITGSWGNVELGVLASLTTNGVEGGNMKLIGADGTTEDLPCCGGGVCDSTTGRCTCEAGFGYDREYGECGSVNVSSSSWMGRQRCLGALLFSSMASLTTTAATKVYVADEGRNVSVANASTIYSTYELESTVAGPSLVYYNAYNGTSGTWLEFQNLFNETRVTTALALDLNYRQVYWAEKHLIYRMPLPVDLDLSNTSCSAALGQETFSELDATNATVAYMELDLREGHRYAYWTVPGTEGHADGQIQRRRLSITNSSSALTEDLSDTIRAQLIALGRDLYDPQGIALDLQEKKIYFADSAGDDGSGFIARCDLDGSNVDIALGHNLTTPRAIALDLLSSYIYGTEIGNSSRVFRTELYNISGWPASVDTLVEGIYIDDVYTSLTLPECIQVDRYKNNKVYFSDTDFGWIYSLPLNPRDNATEYMQLGRPKAFRIDFGAGYPEETIVADCYGHGTCSGAPAYTCTCDTGYLNTCAEAECPYGAAWFDEALQDGTAHRLAECSNMGTCNRATGMCQCHPFFEGAACERMKCPNGCRGRGQCLSMRQLALLHTDEYGTPEPATYGAFSNKSATWDADIVSGCYCDWYGYFGGGPSYSNASDPTGFDCSLLACPTGDDPRQRRNTTDDSNSTAGAFEVQNLTCAGDDGSFKLRFRQGISGAIDANATTSELETALEKTALLGSVVARSPSGYVCTSAGTEEVQITFKTELGDLPLLEVYSSTLTSASFSGAATAGNVTVTEITAGTKLDEPCSRHGLCDAQLGQCRCLGGWTSSDGDGNLGHRNDCGYMPPWLALLPPPEEDAAAAETSL